MGLQTSHLGAIMVINSHAVEAEPKRDVSLHIIIPSVGEGTSSQELPSTYGRAWTTSSIKIYAKPYINRPQASGPAEIL